METHALTFTTEISSISNVSPAFIKMGDLFYEGQGERKKDLFSAAKMYTLAALRKEPQVCIFSRDF